MIGNIYLTCKINVILAKRNIIVVMRRKPDAMTLLPNVNVRDFVAAEMLLLKEKIQRLSFVSLLP